MNFFKLLPLPFMLVGCAAAPSYVPQASVVKAPAATPTATANVRELVRVTNDPAPELYVKVSPDATRALVTIINSEKSGPESLSIVSYNLGKMGRKLVAGPYAAAGAWIDEKNIIYSYMKGSSPLLVKQSQDSYGMRFVSPSPFGGFDTRPHVSKNNKIVFQTKLSGVAHISTVNSDGSDFTVYLEGESPKWNGSGSSIVFEKNISGSTNIFLLSLKDNSITQLTSGTGYSGQPVWSPNGSHIAFISDMDGYFHLYVMRNDGSNLIKLTSGETNEAFPDWASDDYIYFSSDAGGQEISDKNFMNWRFADIWKIKFSL